MLWSKGISHGKSRLVTMILVLYNNLLRSDHRYRRRDLLLFLHVLISSRVITVTHQIVIVHLINGRPGHYLEYENRNEFATQIDPVKLAPEFSTGGWENIHLVNYIC